MRVLMAAAAIAVSGAALFLFTGARSPHQALTAERTGVDWFDTLPNHEIAPKRTWKKHDALEKDVGGKVFDVTYTIDRFRRRVTPPPAGRTRPPKEHAIFLGDAFTFGIGDNDTETIPYYFGGLAPGYEPYNASFLGYAPNDFVARMNETQEDFWDGIAEREGVAFYVLIADHLNRLTGSPSWLERGGKDRPYFHSTAGGKVVQDGTFASAEPERIKKRLSVIPEEQELPLLNSMIAEMRRQYLARFPRGHFYVVAMPQGERTPASLLKFLANLGIPLIDLNGSEDMPLPPSYQPFDAHLPPEANRILAKRLWEGLKR
jgi:hypothetical protein